MTNMLEDLGTRAPAKVLAEETVGMTVGAYGVAMGGSKTYKVRFIHRSHCLPNNKRSSPNIL